MADAITLRPVQEEDLPLFFAQQLDQVATQMAGFPARTRDAFMAHWARCMDDEKIILKTILFNGQVAGNIVCWEQDGEREVGYWLGKEFWGRGIASGALSQFLRHVDERPLSAHVATHNIASIRVLQKCGFVISVKEGFTRDEGEEEFILKLADPIGSTIE